MDEIKVLYINGNTMKRGGIESYMMNYYRHFDHDKIKVDFVVLGFEEGAYDDEIAALGGKVYHVPKKSKNYFGYLRGLRKIFNTGEYKIVHSHLDAMSMTVLKQAKKCNIPIRIAHSHNTQHLTNNFIKILINEYARKTIKDYATHLFSCSEVAGRWLFGNEAVKEGKVSIIKNAIEIDKFTFDEEKRKDFRRKLGISQNEFVIGHVGRFDYQKNHEFLLDVFADVLRTVQNAKLILVGDGDLREKIENKISTLNIKNNVILLGVREDVDNLYNLFDLFLLPSHFEGLGIVVIEAQTNGLPCIVSDAVPKEAKVTEKIKFLDSNDIKLWSKMILEFSNIKIDRKICKKHIATLGYEINTEAKRLQKTYISLLNHIEN